MAGDSSRSRTRARHAHEQAAAESAGGSSGGSSCGDEEEKGDKTLARWCAGGVCECAVSQQERQVGEGTGWASSVRRATPSWIFGVVHSAALRLCSK